MRSAPPARAHLTPRPYCFVSAAAQGVSGDFLPSSYPADMSEPDLALPSTSSFQIGDGMPILGETMYPSGKSLKMKRIAVDLFSGVGGLTCGLRDAGFEVVGAIELDDLAAEGYRLNHPSVKLLQKDIREVRVAEFMREVDIDPGELDLLAGCPPCQAFSTLRSLNGGRRVRDKMSRDLILEFMRFVRGLKPKAIMLENVPRLRKDKRLDAVRRELHQLGYHVICDVLNAADYGVPQRRRRMILIASLQGEPAFAPKDRSHRSVRDAIKEADKWCHDDPLHTKDERRSERILQMIKKIPSDGGSRRSLPADIQLKCHRGFDGFKDIYGRMAWDDVAPTLTSGCVNPSRGRFLHPSKHRAITLREAALLQSFPVDYQIPLTRGKYAAARLIGNALPPEFIRRLAAPVYAALQSEHHSSPGGHENERARRSS